MAAQRNSKILGIFVRLDRARRQAGLSEAPAAHPGLSRPGACPSGAGASCATSISGNGLIEETLALNGPGLRRPRWCWPPASASACGRSPTPCRSRWWRSPAGRCSTAASTRWPRPASRRRSSTSTIFPSRSSRHVASRAAPKVVISDESGGLLDSAGGIVKALPELGSEPFYILNADTFWIDRGRVRTSTGSPLPGTRRGWIFCSCSPIPSSATGHTGGTDFLIGARRRAACAPAATPTG